MSQVSDQQYLDALKHLVDVVTKVSGWLTALPKSGKHAA